MDRAVAAAAVVAGLGPAFSGRGGHRFQFRGGAGAPVSAAGREQLLLAAAVNVQAPGLVEEFAVPVQAQPAESLEDPVGELLPAALRIGVLDAQKEPAGLVP